MKKINNYKKRFYSLLESTIGDAKPLLSEENNAYKKKHLILENSKPLDKINELKNNIEKILGYYYKEGGKIFDKESKDKTPLNPNTLKQLGSYYKTKIESVLVGTEEDNPAKLPEVKSIKDEIIGDGSKWEELLGNYEDFGIKKGQISDFYTDIRCEYFRKKVTKDGTPLEKGTANRPWCEK